MSQNNFKMINKISNDYFKFLDFKGNLGVNDQNRLGFYLFVLESVTGNKDLDELSELIIDTEYSKLIFDEINNDYGIDAVYIDDDTQEISLFNFKFRNNYNKDRGQNLNDVAASMKFFSFIQNDADLSELPAGRTKKKMEEIISRLNSQNIWNITLYMVSNENRPLPAEDVYLKRLKEEQDIEIVSVDMSTILNFINIVPDGISAKLLVDSSSVMKYEEGNLSSTSSYLININVLELVRITNKEDVLRKNYSVEDSNELKGVELEQSVLFDNVRGFLGKTKYNKNISHTLINDPERFFIYNNGITITASNISVKELKRQNKVEIELEGFQIVNGGQTLRTIYSEVDNMSDLNLLNSANILVRIFQTNKDLELTNNIAEFTNSQNEIGSSDLKSVSNLQVQIEQYLRMNKILYVRKVGDTGNIDFEYSTRISMERLGQVLYSKMGYPDRATNQKKRIFEVYYNDVFHEKLDFDLIIEKINEYEEVKDVYKSSGLSSYEQKYFYILYLNNFNYNISSNIDIVEKALEEYKANEDLSVARKLIQKGFKDFIDSKIETKI